jgi:hypothetical protein
MDGSKVMSRPRWATFWSRTAIQGRSHTGVGPPAHIQGFRRSGWHPQRKVPMSRARSVGDELASRQVGADGTPFSSEGALW